MIIGNDLLATILILISAVMHAVVNSLIRGGGENVPVRAALTGSMGFVLLPLVALVPFPTPAMWAFIGVSILVHLFYQHCLIEMYARADLTAVYPVSRGLGPAGVALYSWSMGGWPGWASVAGVVLICGGIFSMAFAARISKRLAPLPPAAMGYALLTGLSIAVYTLIDAAGAKASHSIYSYVVWLFVIHAAMMGGYGLFRDRAGILAAIARPHWAWIVAGLSSIVTYGLALMALRIGDTAELAALRETSIVFALLLGALFLRERVTKTRIAAALVIASGAIVLKL